MLNIPSLPTMDEKTLEKAIKEAVDVNRHYLDEFTDDFKYSHSENNFYAKSENVEWTTGFWTGELWLSYELSGDDAFRNAALRQVHSFAERIKNRVDVEHHDMGFLYSPSCVAAYKLTGSEEGKSAALAAADNLISRFQEKGQFLQAWGRNGDRNEHRLIIDCLLNLPLLFWATETTGDDKYRTIAEKHLSTAIRYVLRPDNSTYHTYYFDPDTGEALRGVTAQGNRNGSAWARGQAWGVYGAALAYRYTKSEISLDVFRRALSFFLSHLPADVIPYWDFDFDNPSTEPRDSSALAIVICGMLEASNYVEKDEKDKLEDQAKRLLRALYEKCAVHDPSVSDGLLLHGTYARKSEWNTCNNRGVDECNLWGDYYYLEALRRCKGKWEMYW